MSNQGEKKMPVTTDETKARRKPSVAEVAERVAAEEKAQAEALPHVGLRVPFVRTTKYATTVIDMQLDRTQATALRAILEGLELRNATLRSGRAVAGPRDALRWLLEEAARTSA